MGAEVFVDDGGNFIEGAGADELSHSVAADDENGGLGGHAVFPGLLQVTGHDMLIGRVFHAGGEHGYVKAEGFGACNLTFDAASPAVILERVIMVIPESALFARAFRTLGDCPGFRAQNCEVTIHHFDLAAVYVGGLNLLGRTKGPAPAAASLEVAIVQDGDEGIGGAEYVPVTA